MVDPTFVQAITSSPKSAQAQAQARETPASGDEDTREQQDVQRDAVFHADAMQSHDDFPGTI